jgi:group I intron endonuclease
MVIYRAMLKYGPSGFILEILEYCDPKEVIIREQYYLDLLKPIYNLLEKASSSLGYRHTKEAIEKMKAAHKERELSEETKAKLKKHLVKFNVKEKCFCVEAINIETKVTSRSLIYGRRQKLLILIITQSEIMLRVENFSKIFIIFI